MQIKAVELEIYIRKNPYKTENEKWKIKSIEKINILMFYIKY